MQDGLGDGDFAFPADGERIEGGIEHRKQIQSRYRLFQPRASVCAVEAANGRDEFKERADGHRWMAKVHGQLIANALFCFKCVGLYIEPLDFYMTAGRLR